MKKGTNPSEEKLKQGIGLLNTHPVFGRMYGMIQIAGKETIGKESAAIVSGRGEITVNKDMDCTPEEWCHIIAHCQLHLAFGHFDEEKVAECCRSGIPEKFQKTLWNLACDIYVEKFLADIKFGKAICRMDFQKYQGVSLDEGRLYEYLLLHEKNSSIQFYGTAAEHRLDMEGLDKLITYDTEKGECNVYAQQFSRVLAEAVKSTVGQASKTTGFEERNEAVEAANWFVNHYPLLGALASSFKIIYDTRVCIREEIQVAAVDAEAGEIFVNPSAGLHREELKFVLAHEFLHAGLQHHLRCQGRNFYLWNVACDYVINGWLYEMKIGEMPPNVLFDRQLLNYSAEEIYDRIVADLRTYGKQNTLRGYHQGDMINRGCREKGKNGYSGSDLDSFYRDALVQGLEYQQSSGRGLIPAGLIEEIRALAMPVIPWDVKLAAWFEEHFALPEKQRSYARPSRRQGVTPDISRPRYVEQENRKDSRTFGVVLDTSGSMSVKLLGMALGSIASYAAAREVPYARVVFCDAQAYDAGYMAPEEIAGRVQAKGRGGTKLQPGIDLLERAEDFPGKGPVLIITDGEIEGHLNLKREHAYLMPAGKRLPFQAKGEVFYFE